MSYIFSKKLKIKNVSLFIYVLRVLLFTSRDKNDESYGRRQVFVRTTADRDPNGAKLRPEKNKEHTFPLKQVRDQSYILKLKHNYHKNYDYSKHTKNKSTNLCLI